MTDLPYDEYLCFDELGITTLVVDEAHNFKNISLNSHTDGVVGMHVKGSKNVMKCMKKYSLSEIMTAESFFQPERH